MASVKHKKQTANQPDWTQADIDKQIALGNIKPGSTPANIILTSDWLADHDVTGVVESIVAGTNITVDATDPANPVISASGGSGSPGGSPGSVQYYNLTTGLFDGFGFYDAFYNTLTLPGFIADSGSGIASVDPNNHTLTRSEASGVVTVDWSNGFLSYNGGSTINWIPHPSNPGADYWIDNTPGYNVLRGTGEGLTGVPTNISIGNSISSATPYSMLYVGPGGIPAGDLSQDTGFTTDGSGNITASSFTVTGFGFIGEGSSITDLYPGNIQGYPTDSSVYLDGAGNWTGPVLANVLNVSSIVPIADGTYTVGLGLTQNGTISTQGGIITAIQEAM